MTKSRGIRVRRGTRLAFVENNQGRHFCGCGCGEVIPIRPEHFNVGIPRFLHGHNPPANRKPAAPRLACGCGCGELAAPGKRYVTGHNSKGRVQSPESRLKISRANAGEGHPSFGKRPANFVGRHVTADGYVLIHCPEHPFASSKCVMQHRLVLEAHMREADPESPFLTEVDGVKYLARWVEVHHVNGIKDDNRVENLVAMTKRDHAKMHAHERRQAR